MITDSDVLSKRETLNSQGYWEIPPGLDTTNFDFSWRPYHLERPYVHQFGTQHQRTGGPRWVVPEAEGVKYHNHQHAIALPQPERFRVLLNTDVYVVDFDWSWHPDDTEPAYIWTFGNQFLSGQVMPTVEYVVPGATDRKFVGDITATLCSHPEHWVTLHPIDSRWDNTWAPHPYEPPYIYVWGNQYLNGDAMPTVEYHQPGATERKYMHDRRARLVGDGSNWVIHDPHITPGQIDVRWTPHPYEPPWIYTWGSKWIPAEVAPTVEYVVPGATQRKYMGNDIETDMEPDRWVTLHAIQPDSFDYSFRPNPYDPPYIYVWGNQHYDAQTMPTIEYHVPGATQRKYMDVGAPRLAVSRDHWVEHQMVDVNQFDLSWRPHPHDPPYIYVWGNKWISGEIQPTIEYRVPDAVEYKFMSNDAPLLPDMSRWTIHLPVASDFDFTWRPHPNDPPYIYVWGNKWNNVVDEPTLEYTVPGATDRKYMSEPVSLAPQMDRWQINDDIVDFDFTWRPHPHDPPYIYVWGNQHYDGQVRPTLEYHAPDATERKYMSEIVQLSRGKNWRTLMPVDTDFDFTWRPHPHDPPYIYVWGNQHYSATEQPTIEYHVPGATDRKYMTDRVATVLPDMENWRTLIGEVNFDWSWRPNPNDPPYIYVWGNQHWSVDIQPTLEYVVPGATQRKYMTDRVAKLKLTDINWERLINDVQFDTSWLPDPREPAYIYVWGNQWNDAATEPTITYTVPGATEYKYMTNIVARVPETTEGWSVVRKQDWPNFDYSWRPNPHSPPQIYQWPDGGPTYTVPGATAVVFMDRDHPATTKTGVDTNSLIHVPRYTIQTTLEDLIAEHPDEVFWALNPYLSYDSFDFDWRPSADNFQHINVFGNELSKDTQTYYINGPMLKLGYSQINYVNKSITVDTKLDMFWVDTGSVDSDERYESVKARYPHIVRTRFANNWVATVNRCLRKATTDYVWILSSDYDYGDFKFDFYPPKWQSTMTHVFGTQWSHWGNTYLVNRTQFPQDTQYIEVIEHLRNINHVRSRKVVAAATKHDVLYIDFGNTSDTLLQLQSLNYRVTTVDYDGSYLNTLKKWIRSLGNLEGKRDTQVWVTTSITDYSNFDWSWQCDPFQREQLHVFASVSDGGAITQKRGDTFLLNIGEFASVMDTLSDLSEYTKRVNYIGNVSATRLTAPIVNVQDDTLNDGVDDISEDFPYTRVVVSNSIAKDSIAVPEVWSEINQSVVVTHEGASQAYLPRTLRDRPIEQIYDYPHIITSSKLAASKSLDVVFISNGEPIAEQNYEHLQSALERNKVPNKIVRVNNIDGRIASQHAAANSADTSWYFLVNGKVRVRDDFDWSWQPDRLQQSKHYIFTVTNPVNGLEYGHQAIVANNRRLTLATTQPRGLDFTLDSLHSVVDINCGVAYYNTDPWTTWRTAFREVVKLQCNTDDVSKERLHAWLNIGNGDHGEWSTRGAQDGVDFWHSVGGDLQQLLNSYDWAWLRQRYVSLYGDTQ